MEFRSLAGEAVVRTRQPFFTDRSHLAKARTELFMRGNLEDGGKDDNGRTRSKLGEK